MTDQPYLQLQPRQIESSNATYATMLAGSNLNTSVVGATAQLRNLQAGSYIGDQVLFQFDTRSIGAASAASLEMAFNAAIHPDDTTIRIYAYDFGDTIEDADWVDDFTGLTLVATILGSAIVADGSYEALTDVALLANINFGGYSRFVAVISDLADQTEPVSGDLYGLNVGWGNDDNQNPSRPGMRLTLTYTGTEVSPAGAHPAPSGSLAILELDPRPLGAQPAPSGRILATALPIRGAQGRPSGQLRGILHNADSGGTLDYVTLGAGAQDTAFFGAAQTYSAARASGTLWDLDSLPVGQAYFPPDTYQCFQAHFEFPTSLLPSDKVLVAPRFTIATDLSYTGDPDVFELRAATIGAWIAGADIDSQTTLIATAPTGSNPTFTVDRATLQSAIDPSYTGFILITRRFRQGVAPTKADDYIQFNSGENDAFLQAPRLTLYYTDAYIQGEQPSASGRVNAGTNRLAQGAQGRPSGTIEVSNRITILGNQPAPSGLVTLASQRRDVLTRGRATTRALPAGRTRIRRNGSL